MDQETYTVIIDESAETWGSAALTDLEQDLLFQRRRELGSWEAVKAEVLSGGPMIPDQVLGNDFVQAAVLHGCPVGYELMANTEDWGRYVWSYITKNRAFRAFKRMIGSTGNETLYQEWVGDEFKQPGEQGTSAIIRPFEEGEYEIPIRGIEKTAAYWPCQMLRVLEAYRTGREYLDLEPDLATRRRELLGIEWFSLQPAVDAADSIEDIAINVAVSVTHTLQERGLDDLTIARIVMRGYDPQPMLEEHGQYESVGWLWQRILEALNADEDNLGLTEILSHEVDRRTQLAYDKKIGNQ